MSETHADPSTAAPPRAAIDWRAIARTVIVSRTMDDLEETKLVPEREVLYQFSARGHDVAQAILGQLLTHPMDAASGYYRSRPLMLALGLPLADAFSGPMGRVGGFSDGRDIGVVCNLARRDAAKVLPMAGGVGTQYTPIVGWAQGLTYRAKVLKEQGCEGAIAVALGGDGSVATNGFWASLNIATTLKLPMLFYIEDNGYGISVPSTFQVPGGNIVKNLASYGNLELFDGDGSDPFAAAELLQDAVAHVRSWQGPALIRLTVPRLNGHSYQDSQAYKSDETVAAERARDPYPALERQMIEAGIVDGSGWAELYKQSEAETHAAMNEALEREHPKPEGVHRHVFTEYREDGSIDLQQLGGVLPEGHHFGPDSREAKPEPARINLVTAVRRTMEAELAQNPRLVLLGEDIGAKGGVHGATMGLQERFGASRVFDTSLSEEGIIGRSVGMAYCGLLPVAEIQFRKYADPATEQLNDCGTIRWRTNNRFAAPMVVRMPGGFAKCGDPWHSMCDEVAFAHAIGWRVAFPATAQDAVGLLRSAMRGNDPTMFFEHRHLLDAPSARMPYPGDDYVVPFGEARHVREGKDLTVVTWGAMVERVSAAADALGAERPDVSIHVLDLRTLIPWDREAVLESVETTGRCLIVHEDAMTAGFGAEIAAVIAHEAFLSLRAPVDRLAVRDIPLPYNPKLLVAALPSAEGIRAKMVELLEFS